MAAPDTAELTIERAPAAGRARVGAAPAGGLGAHAATPASAWRAVWRALWTSHLLAWGAGVGAVLAFGFGPDRGPLDPQGLTRGLGRVGDVLAAAVARWDSAWFLTIAHFGYRPDLAPYTSPRAAYFPAYPLGIRAISWTGIPLVLAGVLLSALALALALYGIHRLAELELPRMHVRSGASRVPGLAVLVTAFSPMAFFFGAVYSEALFMALSVGLFWSARHGRWLQAGLFGAVAAATRSTGLMLAVPALLLYLYGPREDRVADRPLPQRAVHDLGGRSWARARELVVPRYRLRSDVLWLALLPAGVALYVGWMAAAGGDPLAPFHAEQAWSRHLVGPFTGVWDGLVAGFDGARQLLSFQRSHVYFTVAGGDPFIVASHNLLALGFLLAAIPAFVGVFRRLPLAYGAYALAAILLPLSYPVAPQPLMSIPRYLIVLFPLSIWLAAWLAERPRAGRPLLVLCALAMVFFAGQFSTWHWVA